MAKKKTEEAPAEETKAEAPEEAAPEEAAPETISKMEAVRRMLADDPEMKPGEGVEAIKKKYGLEMSTANFSAYKSQIKAKDREGSPAPAKNKGGRPKAAPAKAPAAGASAGPLAAVQDFKALVEKHGAETVKALASLLGK